MSSPHRDQAPGAARSESRRRGAAGALLGSTLLALLACPGLGPTSDDGEAMDEDDAADESRRLDELADAEVERLCNDLNLELETRFDNRRLAAYGCIRTHVNSGDSLACGLLVDECLRVSPEAAPTAPRPREFEVDASECRRLADCSVTEAAFDRCIADRFAEIDRLLNLMNCNLANDPEALEAAVQTIDGPRTPPQSCNFVLTSACPAPF